MIQQLVGFNVEMISCSHEWQKHTLAILLSSLVVTPVIEPFKNMVAYNHRPTCMSLQFAAGEDYEAQTNAPFVFAAGSPLGTTVCVNISIVNDDKVEETESFAFDLSSNDPVDISAGNGVVFIVDDDSKRYHLLAAFYTV